MKTFSMPPGREHLERIDCPVCSSPESRPHWECDGFGFVRCPECGLIYQNPQPDAGALIDRYDEGYFAYEQENESQFFELMKLALQDVRFDDLARDLRPELTSFLDIGCATGMLIASMRDRGFAVHGVEVCEPAARFGIIERGLDIHIGTLEEASLPEASFGVIHSSHLIEHLTAPGRFVAECNRLLADGGYLIITTPNADGLQAKLFGPRWRSAIADHMVLFSRKTIRRLLESHGFQVATVKTWGGIAVGVAPAWIKRPLDRLAKKLGFGDVMIVVAQTGSAGGDAK